MWLTVDWQKTIFEIRTCGETWFCLKVDYCTVDKFLNKFKFYSLIVWNVLFAHIYVLFIYFLPLSLNHSSLEARPSEQLQTRVSVLLAVSAATWMHTPALSSQPTKKNEPQTNVILVSETQYSCVKPYCATIISSEPLGLCSWNSIGKGIL